MRAMHVLCAMHVCAAVCAPLRAHVGHVLCTYMLALLALYMSNMHAVLALQCAHLCTRLPGHLRFCGGGASNTN